MVNKGEKGPQEVSFPMPQPQNSLCTINLRGVCLTSPPNTSSRAYSSSSFSIYSSYPYHGKVFPSI